MSRVTKVFRLVTLHFNSRIASALICAALCAIVGIGDNKVVAAASTSLDNNWRGQYDLLVTAEPINPTLTDASGRNLIDPNFGSVSRAAIETAQVRAVEGLEGVDVAAPLGLLGRYGSTLDWARIEIPLEELLGHEVSEFQVRWEVTGNDGLGTRKVQDELVSIRIDISGWDGSTEGVENETGIKVTGSLPSFDPVVKDGVLTLSLVPLPPAATTVFVVDPVAEKKLLGESGKFLDPLIRANTLLHGGDTPVTPREAVEGQVPANDLWSDADRESIREGKSRYLFDTGRGALTGMYGVDNVLTPYLKYQYAYPPLVLDATVYRLDTAGVSGVGTGSQGSQEIGEASLDVSASRWPFTGSSLVIPWPGASRTEFPAGYVMNDTPTGVSSLEVASISEGSQTTRERPSVTIKNLGYLAPVSMLSGGHPDGTQLGDESVYRRSDPSSSQPQLGNRMKRGAAPIAVGEYAPISIDDDAAAYVPLGAYDAASAYINGNVLNPPLHGLGLTARPASALISVDGAQKAFEVENPITSIRVRVAGVRGYDAASIRRINETVSDIEALGLFVTPVAGASRQQTDVYAEGYAYGTATGSRQSIGDLGPVSMSFTTLMAAESVERDVGQLRGLVLQMALWLNCASLAIVWFIGIPDRYRSDLLLRKLGLTRRQRATWHLRRDLWSICLLTFGTCVSVASSAEGKSVILGVYVVALIVILGSAAVATTLKESLEKR